MVVAHTRVGRVVVVKSGVGGVVVVKAGAGGVGHPWGGGHRFAAGAHVDDVVGFVPALESVEARTGLGLFGGPGGRGGGGSWGGGGSAGRRGAIRVTGRAVEFQAPRYETCRVNCVRQNHHKPAAK